MNFNIIIRSLGILIMLLGVSMSACFVLGEILVTNRPNASAVDYVGWWISILITVISGLAAYGFGKYKIKGKHKKSAEPRILRREAITVVGLGWLLCSLFAALPHSLGADSVSYDKAIFESCSGLTTTGSSIYASVEDLSQTKLLWRSMTQWLGGMGILGAFLLIFSGETRGKTLLSFESSIHGADLSSTDLRTAMRKLWQVYSFLTLICMLGLWMMDMTFFQAINHAFTATATGGFGTENDSITSFSDNVKLWLILFMMLCGISFPLYIAMWQKKCVSIIKRHEETRVYLITIFISSIVLILGHYFSNTDVSNVDTIFNIVTIITTTGYTSSNYETWPTLSKQVIMLLMIVGGCSGSTAGGLKVSRILLWMRAMKNEIIRGFRPNEVLKLQMNGKTVHPEVVSSVYVVVSLAVFFFLLGSLTISLLEPDLSAIASSSAVLSCICNIGPAFGELGPTGNFAGLSSPSLIVLSGLMVLGRLEFIAVLVLFSRRLWKKY